MTEAGDVHLEDLNDERRRQVLVVSNARFNRVSGRVLVAPEIPGGPEEVPFPWRVTQGGAVYAVDMLRSLRSDRLLERTGRVSADTMLAVRRVVRNIA